MTLEAKMQHQRDLFEKYDRIRQRLWEVDREASDLLHQLIQARSDWKMSFMPVEYHDHDEALAAQAAKDEG